MSVTDMSVARATVFHPFRHMLRADALRHIIYGEISRPCGAFKGECSPFQERSFLGGVSVFRTLDSPQRDVVFETSARTLPQQLRPLASRLCVSTTC